MGVAGTMARWGAGMRVVALAAGVLVLAIAPAMAVAAPVASWVRTTTAAGAPSSSDTGVYGVGALPDGGAIAGGEFRGTAVDLGDAVPRVSASTGLEYSGFTQRLRADGTVAWTLVPTGGTGSFTAGLGVLADGGAVTVGAFRGSDVDLGDGVPRTSAGGGGEYSGVVQRLRADGGVAWTRTTTGGGEVWGLAIGVRPDGGALATGWFRGAAVDLGDGVPRTSAGGGVRYSLFTQRLAADGTVLWARVSADGIDAEGDAAAVLPDGGAIVTGYFQGVGVDLGDGVPRTSADSGNGRTAFTMRYAADGTVLWVRVSTGGLATGGLGVGLLDDGGAVVTGYFRGVGVDLGDGVLRTSSDSGNGRTAFTMRHAADGAVVWTRVMPSDAITRGWAVAVQGDDSAVVTGSFTGTGVDLGDGVPRTSSAGGSEGSAFTQRLRADGSVAWVRVSSGGSDSTAYAVSALADGSIAVGGLFRGTGVDLGDGASRTSADGGGSYSGFTLRLIDVPSAPHAPVAAAGDRAATVTVSPLGGSAVSAYAVAVSGGTGGCTIRPPATSCTVTGLANGTRYAFTATAVNAAGSSPASRPSNAVTPTGTPVLRATLLPERARLRDGRRMHVGIRVANAGTDAAVSASACIHLPVGLAPVRTGAARKAGRSLCFALGAIAAGARKTRYITVRATATRGATRTITGRARAAGLTPVRAAGRTVAIVPRAGASASASTPSPVTG